MLPPFEVVDRLRPVDLVAPGRVRGEQHWGEAPAPEQWWEPAPARAPYVALVVELRAEGTPGAGLLRCGWTAAGGLRLTGTYDAARRSVTVELVSGDGRTTRPRSRRFGSLDQAPHALAVTLTGTHLAVLSRRHGTWTARARVDLTDLVDLHDEEVLAGLGAGYDWRSGDGAPVPVAGLQQGGFGQLGLRDLHVATHADGASVELDGRIVLTASHAGPGFFDTGHTGVWTFDRRTHALEHLADLYFRRPDRPGVFGDHATHLVRDGDQWLVATSTWGDFDRTSVAITLARTSADLLTGDHVLDTERLAVPSTGVGVWDPHLARIDGTWHVAYVTAEKFFSFRPALCRGPSLDTLVAVGEDHSRTATEGTVLLRTDEGWRLLASDGRDNPRGLRARYPVYDLALHEVGALDAPYVGNIPWPMVVRDGDGWLMLTFDGTTYGGGLLGHGSHGGVVVQRTR